MKALTNLFKSIFVNSDKLKQEVDGIYVTNSDISKDKCTATCTYIPDEYTKGLNTWADNLPNAYHSENYTPPKTTL